MIVIPYAAPVICIVGLIIFVLCKNPPANPDIKRIGEIMFAAGLLAYLLVSK